MSRSKRLALYAMTAAYVLAGVNHFVRPETYRRIMPPWLPSHGLLIAVSGVAEIVLGLLLLPKATRRWAAWGIILLLIAVFPANAYMAVDWTQKAHPLVWAAYLRLPLQGLLIWWAWVYTKPHR